MVGRLEFDTWPKSIHFQAHQSLPFSNAGNLYYALTHSPKPLSDSEAFTLSWEAATKRLEAAGSIPKKEAEMRDEALRANEAGIEVRTNKYVDHSPRFWLLSSYLTFFPRLPSPR